MHCLQCSSRPATIYDDSSPAVVPCCLHCFISIPRSEGRGGEGELVCTHCEQEGAVMCLACMTYECKDCCWVRECTERCDYYPIAVSEYLSNEGGERRVREGKQLNRAIVTAKALIIAAMERAQAEVDAKFEALAVALDQVRVDCHAQMNTVVTEMMSHIQAIEGRVHTLKYTPDYTPETKLEQFLQASPESTLSELETDPWLVVHTDNTAVHQFMSRWVTIGSTATWFEPAVTDCPWVNRYILVHGKPTRFIDLETMKENPANFTIALKDGASILQLPTAEFFIVGDRSRPGLFLVDSNYSQCRVIGALKVDRNYCGLCASPSQIYIFGGTDVTDAATSTVQTVSLRTYTCAVADYSMLRPRCQFTPCVLGSKVYLIGGFDTDGEVFDLRTLCFRLLPLQLPASRAAVSLLFGRTEIVVLVSEQMFSFNPETEEMVQLKGGKKGVRAWLHPVEYKGEWVFTVNVGKEGRVLKMNRVTHDVCDTGIRFR